MPCSFCGSTVHNISICNHPLIRINYEHIKQIYINVIAVHNTMTYSQNMFSAVINTTFYLKDLRAIGVRYFNVYASISKRSLISLLWNYFNAIDWNLEMQQQQQQQQQIQQQLQQQQQQLQQQQQQLQQQINDLNENIFPEEPDLTSYLNNETNQYIANYMTGTPVNFPQNNELNPHNLANDFASEMPAIIKKYRIRLNLKENDTNLNEENMVDCPICYENISKTNLVKLNCNHEFCAPCIKNTIIHHTKIYNPSCALCREMMLNFTVKNAETYDLISENCL